MSWFWARNKKRVLNPSCQHKEAYQRTLHNLQSLLAPATDERETVSILRFFLQAIKNDIIASGLTSALYQENAVRWPSFPFPYLSEFMEIGAVSVDMRKNDVLTIPWELRRYGSAIIDLSKGPFNARLNYFSGTFFPEFNLVVIENGRHHTAVAALQREGRFDVTQTYRLSQLFPIIDTDGAEWWRLDNPLVRWDAYDFRFPLLFTIAKMMDQATLFE